MFNPKMMALKPLGGATFLHSPTKGSITGSLPRRGSQLFSKSRLGSKRASGLNLKGRDLYLSIVAKKLTVDDVYNSQKIREELNLDVMCTLEHDNRTPNPFQKSHRHTGQKHASKKAITLKSGATTDRLRNQDATDQTNPGAYDDDDHAQFEKSFQPDQPEPQDANKRRYFKLDNTVCNRKVLHNCKSTVNYDPDSDYMHGETDMKTFNPVKEIDNWEITHDIEGYSFANAINVQGPRFDADGCIQGGEGKTRKFESFESSKYQTERLKQFAKGDPNNHLINILNNSLRVKRPGADRSTAVGDRPFKSKAFVESSQTSLVTTGEISEPKKTGQNFVIGGPEKGTHFVKNYADRMRDLNKGVLHQILWHKAQKKIENSQEAVAGQSPGPKIPQTTRSGAKSKSNANIFEKFRSGYPKPAEKPQTREITVTSLKNTDDSLQNLAAFDSNFIQPAYLGMKSKLLKNFKIINQQFDIGFTPNLEFLNN